MTKGTRKRGDAPIGERNARVVVSVPGLVEVSPGECREIGEGKVTVTDGGKVVLTLDRKRYILSAEPDSFDDIDLDGPTVALVWKPAQSVEVL